MRTGGTIDNRFCFIYLIPVEGGFYSLRFYACAHIAAGSYWGYAGKIKFRGNQDKLGQL